MQFCLFIYSETELEAFSIENIASKLNNRSKDLTQEKDIAKFLESLLLSKKSPEKREQSDNGLWSAVTKGRLTAANHHDIFTKNNLVIKNNKV